MSSYALGQESVTHFDQFAEQINESIFNMATPKAQQEG
jgi:hypothetical protein